MHNPNNISNTAIHCESVSKKYGEIEALKGINFDVKEGEIFGIIGPDGAGKTTLFRILTTLILADSGNATVNGFDNAMGELTKYRRKIRRPNEDNEKLGVIFNDYMNCLFGDPTTEKLLPLIDAAAEAGCEYFCIDAGWYSKGEWWDGVGQWLPSKERFPGGIKEVLNYIR